MAIKLQNPWMELEPRKFVLTEARKEALFNAITSDIGTPLFLRNPSSAYLQAVKEMRQLDGDVQAAPRAKAARANPSGIRTRWRTP